MNKAEEILKNAEKHWTEKINNSEFVPIEIPEWGCTIYRPPSLTVYRMGKVKQAMDLGTLDHLIQMIIDVARDEEGKPIFTNAHKDSLLKRVDGAVVQRVANELASALVPEDEEDLVKNSGKVQPESATI